VKHPSFSARPSLQSLSRTTFWTLWIISVGALVFWFSANIFDLSAGEHTLEALGAAGTSAAFLLIGPAKFLWRTDYHVRWLAMLVWLLALACLAAPRY
jgi:hypothetical protein